MAMVGGEKRLRGMCVSLTDIVGWVGVQAVTGMFGINE